MNEFFRSSMFVGVFLTLATFFLGVFLSRKLKNGYLNPLLFSIVATIIILVLLNVDYESYKASSSYLSWFLTPATVCLAIPLYEKLDTLKKNITAILISLLCGVLSSLLSVFLMSKLFGLGHAEYVTMLPKSITTAIGMGVSEELGGYVSITVPVIITTGVLGNIIGAFVCKVFKINEPISVGLAIGCASHAIGTAKAIEIGEMEGAMSSLSIVVSGIITVVLAPLFAALL